MNMKYLIGFIIFTFLGVVISFIVISSVYVFYLKYNNPSTTPLMEIRKNQLGISSVKMEFLPLNKIPKKAIRMVIIAEDCDFYRHNGFNIERIRESIERNIKLGKSKYGASTISQQTARTLMLIPKKTFLRKILEAIITVEMEIILGKDRILELYLNYAEWGKGIFGIQSASKHFYRKSVWNLSDQETAYIVSILPNPLRYSPFSESTLVQKRYELIMHYYNYKQTVVR